MRRVLVLHGPNLDRLGVREPHIYGSETLEAINGRIAREAEKLGVAVSFLQSNHEGALIDAIGQAPGKVDGIVINPGAYGHYSLAIRDALAGCGLPAVEVHLTNVYRREPWRQRLVTAAGCIGVISGFGGEGYVLALRALVNYWGQEQGV
ncbi:MAG: type II 3-dehydroquinate dehydratase [Limnochordaceae bacterium]|uniref:3-dehydroquinate dehydratase n=1 Tax=Carboxydichorda subterranea TaxID=3109565 RepID=A0ABZ1C0L5_9FIRM|nr:type II 3-dehydroquinate dehydratase [Limnochorda sp. L945t]MBE3598161.1 type II 3-dehydroquinate dehydratase [Limnochordaceae bacterium]WRP18316.1 type II 3-dehydroquinate dehydratase [Limnochorda sp. L945t]